jgi:CheY-like chemotaxis protein
MNGEGESIHRSDEVTPVHLIEAGGKSALICVVDPALSARIAQVVRGLGYHVVVAQKPSSALNRLENDQYNLIVLDEGYGGTDWSRNPVLLHLQRLPMPVRRKSFLCLLSEQAITLDHMAAFRFGANLTINFGDVEKMQVVLERVAKDHEAFYAIFTDELGKRGASSV